MNTVFSLKRIGLILRADWIERRKQWAITMGVFLLACVFLLWDRAIIQNHLTSWTLFLSALLFFRFVERKVHRPKGLFLTQPATNPEKFVAIGLVALFYFLSCFLILWGVVGVNLLISDYPIPASLYSMPNSGVVAMTIFFTCWLFASYMTFRKNGFIIGIGLLIALVIGTLRVLAEIVNVKSFKGYDWGNELDRLAQYAELGIYLLSAALLAYSYWRLTKKQIR